MHEGIQRICSECAHSESDVSDSFAITAACS